MQIYKSNKKRRGRRGKVYAVEDDKEKNGRREENENFGYGGGDKG
jgi:hypothetical protein